MTGESSNKKKRLIVVVTSIFLAITYVVFGYVACIATPFTTEFIADISIERHPNSLYTRDGLIEAAKAIRFYSFEDCDPDKLYATLTEIKNNNLTIDKVASNIYITELTSSNADQYGDKVTITSDQLKHLTDVYDLSSSLMFPILGLVSIAVFLIMISLRNYGIGAIRKILLYSGVSTIGLFAIIAIIALLGFDAFFSAFHSALFPQGNWTFSGDSLLIQALPEAFWVKMMGLWIAISCLLAAVSITLSRILKTKQTP